MESVCKYKKTKVVIFEKKKSNNEIVFHYGDNELDIVDSYVYLGINIKNNGTLKPAMESLCNQAIRAVLGMKSMYNFGITDISTKLKLFDSIIKPILLYGCEIWGFENTKVQIRFYKSILGLNRNCSNDVVFGELGEHPMQILCKIRIFKYWCNLFTKRHSLQYKLYSLLYRDCCYSVCKNWASNVRNLLFSLGMNDYWEHQEAINRDNYQCIFNDIKTRIRDQYIQEFFTNINNNARLEKYCIFKTEFVYEEYLNIMDQKARNEISKFRCSAHKLLVERGRYQNVERNRRICKNCNMNMVEDEYHFY